MSGLTVTGGGGIELGRGVLAVGVAAAATVTGGAGSWTAGISSVLGTWVAVFSGA